MKIQSSKNYKMFTFFKENREINELSLSRLIKSMRANTLFTAITVNEKKQIIDGQHRFHALKKLNKTINYVVIKGYGIKEIQRYNSNMKNWLPGDFAHCYKKNKNYAIYLKFKNKYKFSHSVSLGLLTCHYSSTGSGKSPLYAFKNGDLNITKENYNLAVKYAELISDFKNIYSSYPKRAFVFACIKMFNTEGYTHDKMLVKSKQCHRMFYDCSNVKYYLQMLEEIYNYKVGKKNRLRFY